MGPGGVRGVTAGLPRGGGRNASPHSRPPCGPGGGAYGQGRGSYANTTGGAGGSACALRARSSTGSYTMPRARQPRGEGGASHVNDGRVLPRHWRRERKGRDRTWGPAGRSGHAGGAWPKCKSCRLWGRGSHANTRAAASTPCPSVLSPPL